MNNFPRFLHLLLWQFADRRKSIINIGLAGIISTFVPVAVSLIFGSRSVDHYSLSNILGSILMVYWMTCGAFLVNNLNTKYARIATLTLPAGRLEKYTARYLYLLIILPVVYLAGLIVGDLAQMLLTTLTLHASMPVVVNMFHMTSSLMIPFNDVRYWFLPFIGLWYIHSLYLLIGTFIQRHAWIKSTLLIVAFGIFVGLAFFAVMKWTLDAIYGQGEYNIVFIDTWWSTALENLVLLFLIVFNYRTSYRIYSRIQVINNKWYNW